MLELFLVQTQVREVCSPLASHFQFGRGGLAKRTIKNPSHVFVSLLAKLAQAPVKVSEPFYQFRVWPMKPAWPARVFPSSSRISLFSPSLSLAMILDRASALFYLLFGTMPSWLGFSAPISLQLPAPNHASQRH